MWVEADLVSCSVNVALNFSSVAAFRNKLGWAPIGTLWDTEANLVGYVILFIIVGWVSLESDIYCKSKWMKITHFSIFRKEDKALTSFLIQTSQATTRLLSVGFYVLYMIVISLAAIFA